MSAPALTWSSPPEYQPPLRAVPPEPDEFDVEDPTVRWHTPPAVPGPGYRLPTPPPPRDIPVWNEPGPTREVAIRVLTLVLEVLDGRRPITHLRTALTAPVYESLQTRARVSAASGHQHRLRTVRTCRPTPGILELAATVLITTSTTRRNPTPIALAARLSRHDGTWHCTALRPLYPNTRL
jgi:uncharacterized protein DUF6459